MKPKILALYLPQFHPFPENDEWWGKGFTEWTNVGKAKALFRGHDEPRVPTELGYYDLRLPIVREQQAQMAREAGVTAFCYWHYWFGNGRQLMESIFNDVLVSGKPDFPFCLGWANHSWYAKNWNTKDTKGKDRLLIKQNYFGKDDYRMHYEYALKAFKDKRYIKICNKPFFMIFRPLDIPSDFYELWNKWAKEDGFDGIYFVGNSGLDDDMLKYKNLGLSSIIRRRGTAPVDLRNRHNKCYLLWSKIEKQILHRPGNVIDYSDAIKYFIGTDDNDEFVIPNIIPNFDHSPRSGRFGIIYHNSTPKLFYKHCKQVLDIVKSKKNKIIMLRSWNEWGEGNYMEPDVRYGRQYIEALRKAINEY